MSTRTSSIVERYIPFDRVYEFARLGVIAVMLILIVPPVVMAVSISLRPAAQFVDPFVVIPSHIETRWYAQTLGSMGGLLQNSYLRALGSTILGLTISIPTAYTFARKDFPWKKPIFYWIVGVQVFPIIIVLIPLMVTYFTFGIHDTIVGLWLADQILIVPFAVWILRDFFNSLPQSLEGAAQVYGCTQFTAFVRVILPLAMPATLAVGFLAFVMTWNEYLFAALLTNNTARVAIIDLVSATGSNAVKHWGRIMARTMIISTPPAILYLVARKSISQSFSF